MYRLKLWLASVIQGLEFPVRVRFEDHTALRPVFVRISIR